MDDLAELQGAIGDEMGGAQHFQHRQLRHGSERMRHQVQRRRRGSATLEAQLDHPVAHQLADARPPIDMGDDLEQHARRCEFHHRLGFGKRAVREAHGAACDVDGAEIQRTAQRVALDAEGGAC